METIGVKKSDGLNFKWKELTRGSNNNNFINPFISRYIAR